jgi:hypothetical protein
MPACLGVHDPEFRPIAGVQQKAAPKGGSEGVGRSMVSGTIVTLLILLASVAGVPNIYLPLVMFVAIGAVFAAQWRVGRRLHPPRHNYATRCARR